MKCVCALHCVGTVQKQIWWDYLQPYSAGASHCFLTCKETMAAPLCCWLYNVVCRLLLISVQAREIQWVDINLINCLVGRGYEIEAFESLDMTNALFFVYCGGNCFTSGQIELWKLIEEYRCWVLPWPVCGWGGITESLFALTAAYSSVIGLQSRQAAAGLIWLTLPGEGSWSGYLWTVWWQRLWFTHNVVELSRFTHLTCGYPAETEGIETNWR